MIAKRFSTKMYTRVLCFALFFAGSAASFSGFYAKWHFHEEDMPGDSSEAKFERMVDGTANRPFIFRQLLPAIANFIDSHTAESTKSQLYSFEYDGVDPYLYGLSTSPTARNPTYFFRYLIQYILTFLFALLATYAMYFMCKGLDLPPPVAAMSSILFILLFPYLLSVGGYSYDYAELAFFALAILFAARHPWWWLIPLAALGEWNKESYVLFVISLYPILRARSSRANALTKVALLSVICSGVYLAFRIHFSHNPGGTVETQWREQWYALVHPGPMLFSTEETYGIRAPRLLTVLPMALLVWTVCRDWKHLPPSIKEHGKLALSINLPLYFLFSTPGELRDLSMLYCVLILLLANHLHRWIIAESG